jgi:hypothetical protein
VVVSKQEQAGASRSKQEQAGASRSKQEQAGARGRKYFILTCFIWGLCHGSGLAEPGQTINDPGNGFTQSKTNYSGGEYAAVFGSPFAMDASYANWKIGNFGNNANLFSGLTSDQATDKTCATIFGAGGTGSGRCFSNWQIGNFDAGVTLTTSVIDSKTVAGAYAAILGVGHASYGAVFSGWTIGNFGPGARLTASANSTTGRNARATIFGAVWAYDGSNFANWTVGNFGNGASLIASANSGYHANTVVFGTGWAGPSCNYAGWTIGNFGDGARLTASSVSSTVTAFASIFGAGEACDGSNFTGWTIGSFGAGASLTAFASALSAIANHISYAAVFGAAWDSTVHTASIVRDWTVEFRGDATLSAVGFSRYDAHLGTLGGEKNENFRFYFNNAEGTNATVSIAALKLGEDVRTVHKEAAMPVAANQGSGAANYARAIAIGPGFQLNVGRTRTLAGTRLENETFETYDSITSGGQPSGKSGTMNIFGAIAKARMSTGTAGSILRIDSGWTVNAYGPVEDLGAIEINNGTFNAYNTIRNIVAITFNGGNLRIARCAEGEFDESFKTLQDSMRYIGPDGTAYGVGEGENKLVLNGDDYPWKGDTGGKLILNDDSKLVFHVNSSHEDPTVASMDIPGADGVFEFVKGHVIIEDGGSLELNGGKICLINDAPSSSEILPAHTDVWLILTKGGGEIRYYGASEDVPVNGMSDVTREKWSRNIIGTEGCAQLHGDLEVYKFSANGEDGNLYGGIYIANPYDVPVCAIPSAPATRQANGELAGISAGAASALRRAAINPGSGASLPGSGSFAAILGDHFRQSEIDGFGYHVTLKGIACGTSRLRPLAIGHNSVRLGVLGGYLDGKIHFSGSAAGSGKVAPSKFYGGGVFAAYEGLGATDLKTNVNFFAGLQRTENKLSRMNDGGYAFEGKMTANGQFATLEAVEIFHRWEGVQVGPWALLSYNRVYQKGYAERGNSPDNAGAQTVSSVTHNFLDATIGLNAEKDFQPTDAQRYITGAFLKCGWRHRAIQNHSAALVKFNSAALGDGFYPAVFARPGRNSFVINTGLRATLNARWNAFANLHGTLAKDQKSYALSLVLGRNF